MDATAFVLFTIFGVALIWYSYQVWFNSSVLLHRIRSFRSRFYSGILGALLKKMYGDTLDNDPQLELWWTRLGLIVVYGLVIYVIFIATGHYR